MIHSFADKETERFWVTGSTRRLPPDVTRRALRKLSTIDAATTVETLRVPPGNRLERLSGDRTGPWSIRINDQWRVCFRFADGDAHDVEVCDYH
ncbi:MAG: type II toxin-antitoxin system RelE/ParE family toxin [Trueperaceae bacterium]